MKLSEKTRLYKTKGGDLKKGVYISLSLFKSVRNSELSLPKQLGKPSKSCIPSHTTASQGLPPAWIFLVSNCPIHQQYAPKFLLPDIF